jgi:hypothetical protein
MTPDDHTHYIPRIRERRVGERRQSSLVLAPIGKERRNSPDRRKIRERRKTL